MTNKEQCERVLKSLVKSAQFAYGYSEDRAYEEMGKVLKNPNVVNAVKKALEKGVAKK